LSALQRGQRISSDSRPHAGHVFTIVIVGLPYATPRIWDTIPPSRNASAIDPPNSPTM
jgi:hypothetical protein